MQTCPSMGTGWPAGSVNKERGIKSSRQVWLFPIVIIVRCFKTAAILYVPFIVALFGFKDHQGILMKNLLIIIKHYASVLYEQWVNSAMLLRVSESYTVQVCQPWMVHTNNVFLNADAFVPWGCIWIFCSLLDSFLYITTPVCAQKSVEGQTACPYMLAFFSQSGNGFGNPEKKSLKKKGSAQIKIHSCFWFLWSVCACFAHVSI